jgi:Zn-finger nucleic acid-binding protein
MDTEKDRFGETMRLVERAREDIFFAAKDRDLIEKLKSRLRKLKKSEADIQCPKCPGKMETYSFENFMLDRCQACGGVWLDKGELEGLLRKVTRLSLGSVIDRLLSRHENLGEEARP